MSTMQIELTGIDAERLTRILEQMEQRTGSGTEFKARSIGQHTVVTASTHDCMFIIGEMANQGEDNLISAKRIG